MRFYLAAIGVLLLATPAARAQEAADAVARLRAAYGQETAERVRGMVEDARARGLREEALLAKALEGTAKGVPASRLVAVLESYLGSLDRAREILGEGVAPDAQVAGADALHRGVPPGAVRAVADAGPGDLPAALVVVGDLVESGVASETAVTLVMAAVKQDRRGARLMEVSAAVRQLIQGGSSPAEAARTVLVSLEGGGPSGSRLDGSPESQAEGGAPG